MNQHKTETREFTNAEEFEASLQESFANAPALIAQVAKPRAYIICILGDDPQDSNKMQVVFSSVGNPRLVTQLAKEAYEHAQEDLQAQIVPELQDLMKNLPPELASILDKIQRKRSSDDLGSFQVPTNPRDIN